jgi:hypothetical protein
VSSSTSIVIPGYFDSHPSFQSSALAKSGFGVEDGARNPKSNRQIMRGKIRVQKNPSNHTFRRIIDE